MDTAELVAIAKSLEALESSLATQEQMLRFSGAGFADIDSGAGFADVNVNIDTVALALLDRRREAAPGTSRQAISEQ